MAGSLVKWTPGHHHSRHAHRKHCPAFPTEEAATRIAPHRPQHSRRAGPHLDRLGGERSEGGEDDGVGVLRRRGASWRLLQHCRDDHEQLRLDLPRGIEGKRRQRCPVAHHQRCHQARAKRGSGEGRERNGVGIEVRVSAKARLAMINLPFPNPNTHTRTHTRTHARARHIPNLERATVSRRARAKRRGRWRRSRRPASAWARYPASTRSLNAGSRSTRSLRSACSGARWVGEEKRVRGEVDGVESVQNQKQRVITKQTRQGPAAHRTNPPPHTHTNTRTTPPNEGCKSQRTM